MGIAIFFIRCLPSTTYFPEAKLSSTFLPSIFWKYSKTFHQQPENIQRLFRLQNYLSRKSSIISRKYSKTFWALTSSSNQQHQPAAATNSINQQQQSAVSTSSSNQLHQPAAAINSINHQQQSTASTSSSNQQHWPATAINSSNTQLSS